MWHKVDVRYFCSNKLKGLQFETAVVKTMKHIGCELAATKESKDGGVDHQGIWQLPDFQVDIVTQCKNERKPVGVHIIREFNGALNAFSPSILGVFFSASGYSAYCRRYFMQMERPLILCTLESQKIKSFLLNNSAQMLLPKLSIGTYFLDNEHFLILTYGGKVLG